MGAAERIGAAESALATAQGAYEDEREQHSKTLVALRNLLQAIVKPHVGCAVCGQRVGHARGRVCAAAERIVNGGGAS